MRETLRSVGIDLGTSTTQLIFSRLTVENTASPYAVPRMEIRDREILYRSPVHFTPLVNADTLDAGAIGQLLTEEYRRAGIDPADVDTGAVIITGETARKENARAVLEAVSHLAGQFVVATAGPALESVLAARGAGADRCARDRMEKEVISAPLPEVVGIATNSRGDSAASRIALAQSSGLPPPRAISSSGRNR